MILVLVLGVTAVIGTVVGAPPPAATGGVDPAKIPALARDLLADITTITARSCPDSHRCGSSPHVQAESGWNPAATSTDRNGGAAGLYQLNQANWTAAGGHPWTTSPPAPGDDILQPRRHLELAIPWVCANLRLAAEHLRASGKPTDPLDAMLVCHIAGCARVLNSTTGIPAAGEAGCDTHCSTLVHTYIATVHRYLAAYAAPNAPSATDLTGLPDPAPFTGASRGCTVGDPTSRGCLTPATRYALTQITAAFGSPRRTGHPLAQPAGTPISKPASDHPKGRACDLFTGTPGQFATGDRPRQWLANRHLATRPRHRTAHPLPHLARPHLEPRPPPDQNGWGRPYNGGGIYDPTDTTGGHYDHIHVSIDDLVLNRRTDSDVADLDVVGLFNSEGDSPGHGVRRDGELRHVLTDVLAHHGIVDRVGEFGADIARRDRGRTQHAVGRLLPQAFHDGAHGVLGPCVNRHGGRDLQPGRGHRCHEVTAALATEHRQRSRDAVEYAAHVDVDHRRPAVDVQVRSPARSC